MLAGDLQGFPNGRRLTDDVVDIALQALEGAAQTGKLVDALAAGDKVDANDNAFGDTFPYLALPNGVGVNTLGRGGGTAAPAAGMPPAAGARPRQPAALDRRRDAWMTPAIDRPVGAAAVLGVGALFCAVWWRRRRPADRAGRPARTDADR